MENSKKALVTRFFNTLPESSKSKLMKNSRRVTAVKGQIVVEKGDEISGVFLVQAGTMRVFGMHPDGKEATLYHVSNEEICLLSLNSAFSKISYPAWVGVDSKSAIVSVLPSENFEELFRTERAVQDLVMHSLTSTVKELMVRLDEALLSSLKDRIYSFLSNNCSPDGKIKTTHDELALQLGTSREVISREIASLRKIGAIKGSRGLIEVVRRVKPYIVRG